MEGKNMGDLLESLREESELLKQELERVNCELEQTTHEKNLFAEYGIALLEDKQALQHRYEDLESCYDSTRTELELLREALAKYQTNQKVTASSGIEQEESLLLETASKEATFTSHVLELQKELKQARQEESRLRDEKERILRENIDLAKNCEKREKRNYKAELKELKLREQRLLSDNNELEEENISLQKQISSLRSAQQPVLEKKALCSSKRWEVESSGSECLELVYDEQPKFFEKRTPVRDPKPKASELDSSGSECLELVYDEKSHKAIGLSTSATKSGSGKNVLSSTPNDGPKMLPFKTKRKRDGQNITQEDFVRKKFGLPPRKKIIHATELSLRPQLLKKTKKHPGFPSAKARVENSPWKSPAIQRSAPSTPVVQRKFFTKRAEERDTPKSSDTRKPWF